MLQSDINVTPLVDVCLVLLIIFMVVLPAMVNGVDVQLPKVSAGDGVEARVLPVTIKSDGTVYLDTRRGRSPCARTRAWRTATWRTCCRSAGRRGGSRCR